MPGMGESIIILLIVLLVFGAGKLPDIGDALGRSIRNFKRASGGEDEIEVSKKSAKQVSSKRVAQIEEADEDDEDEVVVTSKAKKEA